MANDRTRRVPHLREFVCALVLFAGCGPGADDEAALPADEPVVATTVYAGSYPVAYFAERIGGDRVDVAFPVPSGTDPAVWTPAPETVLAYQGADVILLNGATYEQWVETASLPAGRVVDTSLGLADTLIVVEDAVTHSHGDEGEHSHAETAALTWLDPTLAVRQAEKVRDALIAAQPGQAEHFRDGFQALAADLRDLNGALEAAFGALGDRGFLAMSTDLAYLARRYNLDLRVVPFDAGDGASAAFRHDVDHAVPHSRTMLWTVDPPADVEAYLRERGVRAVRFDPAGGRPAEGDYLEVMRMNASRIEALSDPEAGGS